jgi:hypothetical protein
VLGIVAGIGAPCLAGGSFRAQLRSAAAVVQSNIGSFAFIDRFNSVRWVTIVAYFIPAVNDTFISLGMWRALARTSTIQRRLSRTPSRCAHHVSLRFTRAHAPPVGSPSQSRPTRSLPFSA